MQRVIKSAITVFSNVEGLYEALRKTIPSETFYLATDPNDKVLKEAEIIIADFNLIGPYLYDLPNTKWVQGTWAGIDGLLPFIKDKNLPFSITRFSGDSFGNIMAEYAIAQIVNFEKNLFGSYVNQLSKRWDGDICTKRYRPIYELSIGVMGLGAIGTRIAETLNIFGASISGYGRSSNYSNLPFVKQFYTKNSLPDFLKSCDYIINVLPSTSETIGLLNGDILNHCLERKSVFINMGRGSIIEENDLINALQKKWLGGAILDVFFKEPLPDESPLWDLPQVILTPHISGSTRALDVAKHFKNNLELYYNNKEVLYKINFTKEY